MIANGRPFNHYDCQTCGAVTITVHRDDGVTPMFLRCRATAGCTGMAASRCYAGPQDPNQKAHVRWWRAQTPEELETFLASMEADAREAIRDHHDRGGCLPFEIKDRDALDYQGTTITAVPTYQGTRGRAWRLELPAPGQRAKADHDGTVGMFLVHAPGAHPLWSYYIFCLIHLRPIAGVRTPTIKTPGATHELLIGALDPAKPLPPVGVIDASWGCDFLSPMDVVEQFSAASDAIADRILELCVRAAADGLASPDQDYRGWWRRAITDTAAHFASGTHRVETH